MADVAGGGALIAASIGIYLLLTPADGSAPSSSAPSTSRSAAHVDVVLGPAYAGLTGRF